MARELGDRKMTRDVLRIRCRSLRDIVQSTVERSPEMPRLRILHLSIELPHPLA